VRRPALHSASYARRDRWATVVVLLVAVGAILPGCRLEDRSADPEGGDLPRVVADPPGPGGDDRPAGEAFAPPPVLELGEAFWHGEGTRAVEVSGRFVSPEARAALLDPASPVGRHDGREWRLAEILVSTDFREGPTRARWQVAGPSPLLEAYLAGLRDHPADRSPVSELGVLELEVRRGGGAGES
jgi:hypothetical protein